MFVAAESLSEQIHIDPFADIDPFNDSCCSPLTTTLSTSFVLGQQELTGLDTGAREAVSGLQ